MAKIAVSAFVSLDGVVEAPGGEPGYRHTGWVAKFQDAAQIDWKMREVMAHAALLIGRVTYESFAGAWPNFKGPFADTMNAILSQDPPDLSVSFERTLLRSGPSVCGTHPDPD